MTNHVRWGILGNANIARKALIPAIKDAENAELTAIASRSSSAEKAAAELNIEKYYSSYESLLADPDIDAVYIPLPNALHGEWVKQAAHAGKHVLCEKPAALDAAQATDMIDVCRGQGVLFMEAFMYQFHPQHKKVKEIIASGEIGEVRLMRSRFSFTISDPQNIRLSPTLGGGCLYDVGCYCIHSSRHILGAEPNRAYAQAHLDENGVDRTTAGILTFDSGVEALFDCSFETSAQEYYEVIGDRGNIEVYGPYRPDKNPNGKGRIVVTAENEEKREWLVSGDQYTLQVEHFSECVLNDTEPVYTGEQTVQNMKVIDACYESIRTGEAVTLKE